jgi:hypothetical protein
MLCVDEILVAGKDCCLIERSCVLDRLLGRNLLGEALDAFD